MFKRCVGFLLIAFAATALYAADPVTPQLEKRYAVSFDAGISDSAAISARRTFADGKFAILAFAGYESIRTSASGNGTDNNSSSDHSLDLALGLRRTFQPAEQIRPFAQLLVDRSEGFVGGGGQPAWGYSAAGGIEYFLGRRLSIEGSAGIGYSNNTQHVDGPSGPVTYHTRTFNTFRSTIGVNFYF